MFVPAGIVRTYRGPRDTKGLFCWRSVLDQVGANRIIAGVVIIGLAVATFGASPGATDAVAGATAGCFCATAFAGLTNG